MWRVGIDVGGTFTDLFGWNSESQEQTEAKVLTTKDRSVGVVEAVEKAGIKFSEVSHLIHGTTTATNTLIQRSYPPAAMIATRGFRDSIEIGRQHRKHLYDPYQTKPKPIIPRRYRFEVEERINVNGDVVRPLDHEEVETVALKVKDLGIKSVAVCFVNSYVNSSHEEAVFQILQDIYPEVRAVTSASTRPIFREHGRFSTTAIRAVLLPVMSEYFEVLQNRLRNKRFEGSLLILKSSGGVMGVELAKDHPEELIESGPAGGVACTAELSRLTNRENLIHTDMGGTSFAASIVEYGKGLITHSYDLEWEVPIVTPMLDIHSVGAGGGSIGWIDEGDSLRVGPQSAGATPGPACYGRGGSEPTITDANLVLGRLEPSLGGKFKLDVEAAEKAVGGLANRIGLSLLGTAEGMIKISCENMAQAVKMVLIERGRDPRDFTLASLGGAGAMHAVFVARGMNIPHVIVPKFAGVASAFGATVMDLRQDLEAFMYAPISSLDFDRINRLYRELEHSARSLLAADGMAENETSISRSAQMRYVGQTYEVETPIPIGDITPETVPSITEAFHRSHKLEHGVSSDDFEPAFVSLSVTATGSTSQLVISNGVESGDDPSKGVRRAYFSGTWYDALIFNGQLLNKRHQLEGPAIIEYEDACAVLPPNSSAVVDELDNLVVSVGTD